jgi:pimeloyl-ACP methyl ester carboxylesterase
MQMDTGKNLATTMDVSAKVAQLYQTRVRKAFEHYDARVKQVRDDYFREMAMVQSPLDVWRDWAGYTVDSMQRGILFLDAMRQRGNQYLEHTRSGLPPVLHFDYEMVMDGRTLERAVNYALVRIVPPAGVTVDAKRRPYVIIDPRAGHGPGIGGFKDDSQVGVALREGHPVYFVIFFPRPEPGQTLLDVCAAERRFIERVRELHPASPKPAIVGNCQGGWAAMMLAASHPEDTGPIVINGAPMSYWGGAWEDGPSDNPMRYAGGMLGGTWMSSMASDMGAGLFDGAYLVQNFEGLNPANTWWDKYYNVYSKVDSEVPRFLEFERWWGGFYLMNREEIEWITQNLFVGNKLWTGGTSAGAGKVFDLRAIRSPIVLFASMGDNITPPQQAFNWVADVYGSTDEIKARGQVIVGLLHENAGHLGIFVSGSVARKEHAQIVSVLKSIEALPPGLYGMAITEVAGDDEKTEYRVEFREHRLEEIAERLNRFKRKDERAFEAVARISDFNQRAYELFGRPLVQATANEASAKLMRDMHPLRAERWSLSDLNPWLAWLGPAADAVREQRTELDADSVPRQTETAVSELISATLDCYRAVRDAASEAMFFQTFGSMFALTMPEDATAASPAFDVRAAINRELVENALASIGTGGYDAAVARIGVLLARNGEPLPLERLAARAELRTDYADLLPDLAADEWRRLRGLQEIIVRHAPQQALSTLPGLLASKADRERLQRLVDGLARDPRMQEIEPTTEQRAMLDLLRVELALAPRVRSARGSGAANRAATTRSARAARARASTH